MKIYLDTCSLQRPLDDQSQLRIRLEAEAILSILDLVHAGDIELVSSDALDFEIKQNPYATRRDFAEETVAGASAFVDVSDAIENRAAELNRVGIDTLDSLHLASAEAAGVDYLCTCDDTFLTKAKREARDSIQVVSPLELVEAIDRWQSQQDH